MGLIGQKEKDFLVKEFAAKLVNEVRLVVFTQEMPCVFCRETVEVARELSEINPKIKLEIYDFVKDQTKANELRVDKIPAIAVIGAKDHGVRFYGIPSGYEFTSLIGAIIDVSTGESGLTPKTKDALKLLGQSVHIQVFVTPTCPYCPAAVRLAHKLAIESDMIWADMVEAIEFVPLAQKYGVMGVPKIIINEKSEIAGFVPEDLFVAHVLHSTVHTEPLQPR
ncbi:MAG TPA: thioredoxin family protein [Thermoplasmata archaeon]|jgi:glutaredoxin-like protein